MSIRLLQEIENDKGTNKYPFSNFLVVYELSGDFKKKNKGLVDQIIRQSNNYWYFEL